MGRNAGAAEAIRVGCVYLDDQYVGGTKAGRAVQRIAHRSIAAPQHSRSGSGAAEDADFGRDSLWLICLVSSRLWGVFIRLRKMSVRLVDRMRPIVDGATIISSSSSSNMSRRTTTISENDCNDLPRIALTSAPQLDSGDLCDRCLLRRRQ